MEHLIVFIAEAGELYCGDSVQKVFRSFASAADFIKKTESITLQPEQYIGYNGQKLVEDSSIETTDKSTRWATISEKEVYG